jgi:alkanesulfonate monooxygenase SsuD/methylene tetrahydromethanopterin reductase-like flavin-dependent oxidoreductase (luciferase family)
VQVGLILPVFDRTVSPALAVARHAEAEGIDGVFSYDHLFPINRPDRPSLAAIPVLAAVAVATERITLGTLVSRVTLLPVPVLVSALSTLDELSGGRAVAGLGTGDSLTRAENVAYGMGFPPVDERLELLRTAARELRRRGVRTWIGGRSARVRELAAVEADGWNSWDGPLAEVTSYARLGVGEATWGGPLPADGDLGSHLRTLAEAGAAWAIYGPPPSADWPALVSQIAGAAKSVR